MIGVVSYGFYVPIYRIRTEEIAQQWGKDPQYIKTSLNIHEKSVSRHDEDALTMAYEASNMALQKLKLKKDDIGFVFVGSETHPYIVNPTATILAEYLDLGNKYVAYDTQFACKAATGALISGFSLIKSGFAQYGMVVGADKGIGKPGDALDYTAGSAGVSLVLGSHDVLLEYIDSCSYSSDTPDFWKRNGTIFPSHAGRFTSEPGYFFHIKHAVEDLFKKTSFTPKKIQYVVFHSPNGRFPMQAAKMLGFEPNQLEPSLCVPHIGNSYTASSLLSLCSLLDVVKPDDTILLASYGSGAGSDAFLFRVTKHIKEKRQHFSESIKNKTYLDYKTYQNFSLIH